MHPLTFSVACFLSVIRPPGLEIEDAYLQAYPIEKAKCPFMKENRDVSFRLYTRRNPVEYQELFIGDDKALSASNIDFNDHTVVYFHAFLEGYNSGSALTVREAYMLRGDTNFIVAHAQRLEAGPWYPTAADNTWYVGRYGAIFIDYLVSRGLDLKRTHLVGHSLGAQAAGVAGGTLISGRVARITGLDPAKPLFQHVTPEQRLDPGDADFVDVIHTDAGIFGMPQTMGHADFYPNGGISPQPGCELEVLWPRQMILEKCRNRLTYKPLIGFFFFVLEEYESVIRGLHNLDRMAKIYKHLQQTERKIQKYYRYDKQVSETKRLKSKIYDDIKQILSKATSPNVNEKATDDYIEEDHATEERLEGRISRRKGTILRLKDASFATNNNIAIENSTNLDENVRTLKLNIKAEINTKTIESSASQTLLTAETNRAVRKQPVDEQSLLKVIPHPNPIRLKNTSLNQQQIVTKNIQSQNLNTSVVTAVHTKQTQSTKQTYLNLWETLATRLKDTTSPHHNDELEHSIFDDMDLEMSYQNINPVTVKPDPNPNHNLKIVKKDKAVVNPAKTRTRRDTSKDIEDFTRRLNTESSIILTSDPITLIKKENETNIQVIDTDNKTRKTVDVKSSDKFKTHKETKLKQEKNAKSYVLKPALKRALMNTPFILTRMALSKPRQKRTKRFISLFQPKETDDTMLFKLLEFLLKHRKSIVPVVSVVREINTLVKSANGELNHSSKEHNSFIGTPANIPPPVTFNLELGNDPPAKAFIKKLFGFRGGDRLSVAPSSVFGLGK